MTNSPHDAADIAARLHRLTGLNQTQIDSLSLSLDPVQVDQISDAVLATLVNGTLPTMPLHPDSGLPLGLPGATVGTRWVGATASGAPTTGTFAVRDWIVDGAGSFWICTVAGSPGTWVQVGGTAASALIPTAVKTANYTLAASDFAKFDTTSGALTGTLPTAPADKTRVGLKIVIGSNALTIACGGSDVLNKTGGSTSATLSLLNQSVTLQYQASGAIWNVVSGDLPLSQLDLRYALPGKDKVTGPGGTAGANAGATQTLGNPTSSSTGYDLYSAVLSANLSLALPAPVAGGRFTLRLTQDGTGSRTVSFVGTVNYPSGPVQWQTAASTVNEVFFSSPDGVAWEALPLTASGQELVNAVTTSGAAQTIPDPVTAQSISRIVLSADCTFTFPSVAAGKSFVLVLVQDATGSRAVTWPSGIKWPAATAPTLSSAANKVDYLTFLCVDGSNWAGFVSGLDLR